MGAANFLGASVVLDAVKLIGEGAVIDLAHPLDMSQPDSFHNRKFSLIAAGSPSGGPVGEHQYMYNEEWVAGEITGIGTQFDALSHIGQQLGDVGNNNTLHYYNGFRHSENVPPIFTPAVLIDLTLLNDAPVPGGAVITKEMLVSTLDQQGLSEQAISPGSVVLIRQGRDVLWDSDPVKYSSASAGLNREAAEWLAAREILAVGSDSIAMEPIPPVNNRLAEIHALFIMRNGIYMFENLDLERLSVAKVYRFAFAFGAIPIVGAQGSAARPFAIY
jgi:kynurenine formamidase